MDASVGGKSQSTKKGESHVVDNSRNTGDSMGPWPVNGLYIGRSRSRSDSHCHYRSAVQDNFRPTGSITRPLTNKEYL